ncbi:MAG: blue (type1) copper protein [uncultured bacterium]|nr:MAG: blue (type1) copper protein [uncultured bacterium]OGE17962.1 MAG: hypothetical protein A2769_01995 [Candidatus Daviesbacteria bacterium RIFCSPHIGHO2_01_FULL_37_27]
MKLNTPVLIIIGVIVLGGLFFVFKPKTQPQNSPSTPQSQTPTTQDSNGTDEILDLTNQKEVQMDIQDYAFQKPNIRIKVGTKVTWTNRDSVRHTATADDGSFDTGLLAQGESGSYVFTTPGTFGYYCIPHPNMRGTIIVEGDNQGSITESKNTFNLVIKEKKVISGPTTIKINQGDEVTIKITSDEAEEFHVHAYDNSVELEPNKQATLTFTANLSGRFPFELENSKTEIGALEVQPK